jgi:hypothetical protein
MDEIENFRDFDNASLVWGDFYRDGMSHQVYQAFYVKGTARLISPDEDITLTFHRSKNLRRLDEEQVRAHIAKIRSQADWYEKTLEQKPK